MCWTAATWRINMYQIGNCACTKTAHKTTYFEGLWADRLLPICCFALENNSFYCSKCYYRTCNMFRAQNFSCSNKTVPSSRSQGNSNVALLTTESPDFISLTLWPPNSLDLNPVGYCVWNVLQERVYYWTKVVPSANAQWRLRLHACIRPAGEDFEHCLQWHYPLFM